MDGYRNQTDAQLLAQCRFEAFRGPGPGGQKRNKTNCAVRLTHRPSGISVIAGESRSQHQNRAMAIRRLRHRMALQLRQPIDQEKLPLSVDLAVSHRSEEYLNIMGTVLDVLAEAKWSVSQAAGMLGFTTAPLVGFLKSDEKLWAEVNQHRQRLGLNTLH